MKTEMKHTPTPWRMARVNYFPSTAGFEINSGANWYAFAKIEGDAEFIVRAVNSHEELLEALKELVQGHSIKGEEAGRKAITKAEGR